MGEIRIIEDVEEACRTVLRREALEDMRVPPALEESLHRVFGRPVTPAEAVDEILGEVRARGDQAVREWTRRIDGLELERLEIPTEERRRALENIDGALREAMELAAARIQAFHRRQHVASWADFDEAGVLGQIVRPLERVGVYVPAGTAPLPSSLLMAAIPARVAGVSEVVVTSPADRLTGEIAPVILAAAEIAGVDRVFAVGGAQAVAAMAYGTESIPRVDKIVGPGNLFVVLAKRRVYGMVGIAGLPGPTETLIIADESASPAMAAADMLAQAEHDPMAAAILLTPSRSLAGAVREELGRRVDELSRRDIIAASLAGRSAIILVQDVDQAIELANAYAPEHLCLLTADPWSLVGRVRNAGGIFVGESSFEVLGDYVAGPSHIMPTGGTARFASPLNVFDFVKIISLVGVNRHVLEEIGPAAARIALAEGLTAHAGAVGARGIFLSDEEAGPSS